MIKKSLKMLMSCNKEWLKIQPLLYMARKNDKILVKVMEAFLVLKSGIFWILNYSLKILNLKLKLIWWFKFVTSLVIEFKKMKSNDATRYSTFYSNLQIETVIYESNIDDVFESTVRLYQTFKNPLKKVVTGLLIQSSTSILIFQSTTP